MPQLKLYGAQIDYTAVGPRQVPANPATKAASPPIQIDKHLRNGFHPNAQMWNLLLEATNQAALYRTREVFRSPGRLGEVTFGGGVLPASAAGTNAKWRFAFRTSAYGKALMAFVNMHPMATSGHTNNTYAQLKIFSDATETTTVTTTNFYYGSGPSGTSNMYGWQYMKLIPLGVEGLSVNTDYYGVFYNVDYARIQSCSVAEFQSMTENFTGYMPQNLTNSTDIVDVYREKVATMQKNLWKTAGGLACHFVVADPASPQTIAGATPTNVVDNSSTTISAATPGFTLDMSKRDRLMQSSGVPVVLKIMAKTTSGTGKGRFYLKDSAGNTVMSKTDGLNGTATWYSITGYLPATEDKYDLMYDNNSSGTLSCYAASLYEYEA